MRSLSVAVNVRRRGRSDNSGDAEAGAATIQCGFGNEDDVEWTLRPVKPSGPWYRESKFRSAGLASLGSLFPWPLSPGIPLREARGRAARRRVARCMTRHRPDRAASNPAGRRIRPDRDNECSNPSRLRSPPQDRHIVKMGGDDIRESAGIVGFSDPEIGFRVPCLQHFLRRLLAMSGGHPQQRLFDLAASPHRAKIVMGDRQPFFDDAPDIARIDLAHRRRSHRGWLPATASRQFRSGA